MVLAKVVTLCRVVTATPWVMTAAFAIQQTVGSTRMTVLLHQHQHQRLHLLQVVAGHQHLHQPLLQVAVEHLPQRLHPVAVWVAVV